MSGFIKWCSNHKRGILTTTSVVCTVAAPLATAYFVPKALKKIEEKGATTTGEKIKVALPYLITPVLFTAGGAASSIINHNIATGSINAAQAFAAAEQTSKKLIMNTIKEELPAKKVEEIEKKVLEKEMTKIAEEEKTKIESGDKAAAQNYIPVDTGYGTICFFDKCSKVYLLQDPQNIRKIVNDLNEEINRGVYPTEEDWCIKIGVPNNRIPELASNLFFLKPIRLVMDGDHFWSTSDNGNPLGVLEFETDCAPEYIPEARRKALGIPYL